MFINKKNKLYFLSIVGLILSFLTLKSLTIFNIIKSCFIVDVIEVVVLLLVLPFLFFIMYDQMKHVISTIRAVQYSSLLNELLVTLSRNSHFYEGNLSDGSKTLTSEVSKKMRVDRCSIWLYNKKRTSLICHQLYVKNEGSWYDGDIIYEKDYKPYFKELKENPVIVANDVTTHSATTCFNETYTTPLGIKSMLDVPILYRGDIIGVICLECTRQVEWSNTDITFTKMLASLFAFAYSVNQINQVKNELFEFEHFIDSSVLVSKTDKNGRIIYVNEKFEDVSGWSLEEVVGKDHDILNSGHHGKLFWKHMYKVVNNGDIWNDIVINKRKNGELYWVDTYVKANFDEITDKVTGYISIRQDVTDLFNNINELNKKNVYLEHAAKILRHDMNSGINIYIPRGVSALERRLSSDDIEKMKLESPIKLIKEGLKHTQKVYKGVYEFTNLVRTGGELSKDNHNLKDILLNFLSSTSYSKQVIIDFLPTIEVNESLFCTAIDNLIRNGLKYNDSNNKMVSISMIDDNTISVQDNGRGLTQDEFEIYSQGYTRKINQKEGGTGLGLNICLAILKEHGFKVTCEKNDVGTNILIKIKNI